MKNITWDYIAGFFDADGCLHKRKNANSFAIILCNTDILMIESMQKFLLKQKIQSQIYKALTPKKKKYYHLHIGKRSSVQNFILNIKDKSISQKLNIYSDNLTSKYNIPLSGFEKDQIRILYKYGFSLRNIGRAINKHYMTVFKYIS